MARDTPLTLIARNTMDLDRPHNPDCIVAKPPYPIYKAALNKEKLLKVRQPDVYKGKNLQEWRTFYSQ